MERREKVNAVRQLAVESGRNISMDPERWGENMLDSLENGLQAFLAQLPEDVRDMYEDKYIDKFKEWLYALSRCFSQAITGAGGWKPATFRRHERTNAAEKSAHDRLVAWCDKVIKRCNRQERLTGWAEVERLQEKLDSLTRLQENMKAINKIIRSTKLATVEKVDEIMALGLSEEQAIDIMDPDRSYYGAGFPAYALQNNLAKIKDTEAKIKRHQSMAERENEETEYPWGTLVADYGDARYRFLFNGKPEREVIDLMKSNAFKWSPRNEAWQRQITPNARYAVKNYILPKLAEIYQNEK